MLKPGRQLDHVNGWGDRSRPERRYRLPGGDRRFCRRRHVCCFGEPLQPDSARNRANASRLLGPKQPAYERIDAGGNAVGGERIADCPPLPHEMRALA